MGDFYKYRSDLSFDEKLQGELLKEIATTLGRYGNKIENAVKEQRNILEEIKEVIYINEKYQIQNRDINALNNRLKEKVIYLIGKYNESWKTATKFQYYLNIQKEALKFRGFDSDPYGILPKLRII
ncbi:hypothetical protein [Thermohalobacter berrensis]|uniref:Uncharacterized protein n=1 Tax=Thermohalobacter berrensis TaxID=99594 RepID=A0A419SWD8_9FIRM|nr:hypothetical protein [Thermohalobacter berrensis]RKD29547.1 hypothetical protein BET03_05675 [Thermohalobacter berrensis]